MKGVAASKSDAEESDTYNEGDADSKVVAEVDAEGDAEGGDDDQAGDVAEKGDAEKKGDAEYDSKLTWQERYEKLIGEAAAMQKQADKSMTAAQKVKDDQQPAIDAANAVKDDMGHKYWEGDELIKKAKDLRAQAEEAEKQAKEKHKEAGKLEKEYKAAEKKAAAAHKKLDKIMKKAEEDVNKTEELKDRAREELERNRNCVDFPGIRMKPGSDVILEAEGYETIKTPDACRDTCAMKDECRMSIWVAWKSGCYLYGDAVADPEEFKDAFNSSFCAPAWEHDQLMGMLDDVYKQVPYIPPLHECSWSGEDCTATYCCNDMYCNKEFTDCRGYTCYKQDEYFAGCLLDPPGEGWSGEILGGPRETREIPPADERVKLQGSSLFCFSVINWNAPAPKSFWATEAELAKHIKDNKVSIFQCDEGDFFDGIDSPKAEWGSFSNIDAFAEVWKNVKNDGRWMEHDWTVKVDADAVFFPDRLKEHIQKLRTPRNSRVYLKNINYQFQFMGALEVFTKEALEVYFEKGDTCIRGEHEGGEDRFMQLCLDSLGVDHQTDWELLRDKYCLTCPDRDEVCTDGRHVAYHFHKKIISWDWCYNEAVCGGPEGDCEEGIEVEFVMDH